MFTNIRKLALGGLLFSIIIILIGITFKQPIDSGFCLISEPTCINTFSRVGNMLYYGMSALAIVFAMLLVFPKSFPAWKKFAVWAVPSIAILFALYTDPQSGDLFSPYAEQVYSFVSKAFVVISIAIIAITDYRTHSTSKKKR